METIEFYTIEKSIFVIVICYRKSNPSLNEILEDLKVIYPDAVIQGIIAMISKAKPFK